MKVLRSERKLDCRQGWCRRHRLAAPVLVVHCHCVLTVHSRVCTWREQTLDEQHPWPGYSMEPHQTCVPCAGTGFEGSLLCWKASSRTRRLRWQCSQTS
jgi:hypothetical protein